MCFPSYAHKVKRTSHAMEWARTVAPKPAKRKATSEKRFIIYPMKNSTTLCNMPSVPSAKTNFSTGINLSVDSRFTPEATYNVEESFANLNGETFCSIHATPASFRQTFRSQSSISLLLGHAHTHTMRLKDRFIETFDGHQLALTMSAISRSPKFVNDFEECGGSVDTPHILCSELQFDTSDTGVNCATESR